MTVTAESIQTKFARALYSLAWLLATPLVLLYLLYRSYRQPAYRRHWGERFGFFGDAPAPRRPLIWLHAVSVGETRAAQPLVRRLLKLYPEHDLLITNGTPTGRAVNRELFSSKGVRCSYLPYDHPIPMARFYRHFRPKLGIIMETELWPNLVAAGRQAGVPLVLVNARLSEKSLRKGLRWPWLIKPALAGLDQVLAQSERDAARLVQLGRRDAGVAGNLKFDALVAPDMLATGQGWRERIGQRQVVLFASSRDGEEERVLAAWAAHGPRKPLLIVVPRHPERFAAVRALMEKTGLQVVSRSAIDVVPGPAQSDSCPHPEPSQADLMLGNSMGEMFAYYGAADVVIMGGSLLPFGGQNLIEACASGKPVIVGPNTYNFEEATEQAIDCGAAVRADGPEAAVGHALRLLVAPDQLTQMADAATRFAAQHGGATRKTLVALAKYLEK